jgi:pimeloyl-ACP methyl ester carboxylesterase
VHPLASSFGKLPVPALALWSEKDEYGYLKDQRPLLDRWEKAAAGKLEARVVKGASHGVAEVDAQGELVDIVVEWLKRHHEG